MNTHAGYSKKTLIDTNVLLTGGGDKSLADFLGGIQYVSASHKILIKTAAADASWTDLVTLVTTDENVKLTPKTDDTNRPLMMINGGTSTGELTSTSMFSTGIYANAKNKTIISNGFIKTSSDDTYVLLGGGGHKAITEFKIGNYLPLAGGTMNSGAIITLPNNATIVQNLGNTSNYTSLINWKKNSTGWYKDDGTTLYTYCPQIGLHNTGGNGSGSICILPYATESAPWGGTVGLFIYKGGMKLDNNLVLTVANSSVSKSGETLTVNIGGTSLSLTNTWRDITDSYSGTDSTISLSQKGGKALYDALLNGYASSAGNSDTVDGYHADSFLIKRGIRSDLDDLGTLRYNFGGFDRNDYNGTYKDLYPVGYGQYISLQYSDSNTAAQMFFECPAWSTTLGHVYVRTRGAGTVYDYSAWGVLAYTTDNVASATKLQTARTLTIGNTGKTFNGTADVSWTLAEIGAAAAHSHPYLPTAGGTMTGDITMSGMNTNLNWDVNYLGGWARDFIVYNQHNNNNSSGALVNVFHLGGYGDGNGFQYAYIGTASYDGNNLRFNKDGTITIGSGTVWHSNNDGSGSGLDADTLDGYHASSFLTSHLTVSGTFWGQSWSNGGTVNGHITMSGEYGLSGYMPRKKDGGGGWAYSLVSCRDLASTVFMLLGVYGGGNSLSWIYLGSNGYDGNNLRVYSNGNTTAPNFYTYSDRNKKLNITMFSEHIRKFQLKDTEKYAYGVIAQEVEEMFRDGEEGNMTVNYNSVLSFYIGQLENKVKMLEERIKRLESK